MIKNEYLIIGVIIASVWYCCLRKENYGFRPLDVTSINIEQDYDMSKMKEVSVPVTPDMMQNIIFAVSDTIRDKTGGLCTYAINVPYVRVLGDDEDNVCYKAKIMFLATQGFPYGFEVDTTIVNDEVVKLDSRSKKGMSVAIEQDVYVPFNQIETLAKPAANALPNEFGIAGHSMKDNHYIY